MRVGDTRPRPLPKKPRCARRRGRFALLAVKLDDELLVDGAVHVVADGQRHDARAHLGAVGRHDPVRAAAPAGGLPRALDVGVLAARLLDADGVAGLDLERRDIDLAPVDLDVPVVDELARLAPRGGEARAVDRVVEPALKQAQEVLARDALHARRALEVVTELPFEHEVDALDLLLLAKLQPVALQRLAAAHRVAVLSGRLRAALLNRARRLEAAVALQKQFRAFAAAQTAHRTTIPSHSCFASGLNVRRKSLQSARRHGAQALRPLG